MKSVRFERHDSVRHIVLGNPPLNLIATAFSEHLGEAIHAASEANIRALLVRAEGPNFSQGGDILDFIDMEFNAWHTFIRDMHHAYRKIEALQIPTVCAVRDSNWCSRATWSSRRITHRFAASSRRSAPYPCAAPFNGLRNVRGRHARRAT